MLFSYYMPAKTHVNFYKSDQVLPDTNKQKEYPLHK